MTTTDHVLAACGSLRTAWGWLATSTTPGRARRNQKQLNERQIARRNERAAEERVGKVVLVNAGTIVGGGQPPADLAAIDARTRIAADIDQLAAELSLAVATIHRVGAHYTDTSSTDARFLAAVVWVSRCAGWIVDVHLADDAYQRLTAADRLARAITGDLTLTRRLAASCPSCGRRSLAWDTSSPEPAEWFVACTSDACRCRGRDCMCKLPDRHPGMTHLWLAASWNRLARQLEER